MLAHVNKHTKSNTKNNTKNNTKKSVTEKDKKHGVPMRSSTFLLACASGLFAPLCFAFFFRFFPLCANISSQLADFSTSFSDGSKIKIGLRWTWRGRSFPSAPIVLSNLDSCSLSSMFFRCVPTVV